MGDQVNEQSFTTSPLHEQMVQTNSTQHSKTTGQNKTQTHDRSNPFKPFKFFIFKKSDQSKCGTPGYVWGLAKFKCSCRFILHPQHGRSWREFIVAALVGYKTWDFHIWGH